MLSLRDRLLLERISGDSAAAILASIEAASGSNENAGDRVPQRGFPFQYERGTSERRCVEVGTAGFVRSGNYVMFSFRSYWGAWINGSSGFRYQPMYLENAYRDSVVVSISRLDRAIASKQLVIHGAGQGASGARFFGHNYLLPGPGRWLFVVTGGANWGCFVYEMPVVGRSLSKGSSD